MSTETTNSTSPSMHPAWRALQTAFPYTMPIFAGFLLIGIAYGVFMNASGFSFIYPALMSLLIFAGSVEFLTVPMLLAPFNPLHAFLVALIVNARHIFYGISMLEKYRGHGLKTPYLIYGMCDESFSINFTAKIPADIDKGWFFFWVTLLNHLYWVGGATIGGLCGSLLTFDTRGLDFVLTAMFVSIFTEQWLLEESHQSSLAGIAISLLCLMLWGPEHYLIPTLLAIFAVFALGRHYFAPARKEPEHVTD
ncbi:AzlC family ABC transporter permease [Selenomonas sp.]|uniref:AzlC family ABC transporter permease n=1 Tax=Selenomonas sp. TaxID=2053611 RepID=UPI0025F21F34|nr:AzlC family ABC transporter permease [Selenomonas sp.]